MSVVCAHVCVRVCDYMIEKADIIAFRRYK